MWLEKLGNQMIQFKTRQVSAAALNRTNEIDAEKGAPATENRMSQLLWRGITVGRDRKRKEVRTQAPTHPRQSSQAAVIAVTHTAPATHTPGAAARCCCTLHQPGHPEASLLPRRSMLCSSASHSLRDQREVPPVPRQPKWVGGSGIPACTRSQPQSICALKHCTISILSFFPHPSSHTVSRRRKKLRFRLSGKVFPEERWWGEGDSCWAPCHAQEQRLFLLSRLQFFTCHLLWSHFAFISVV